MFRVGVLFFQCYSAKPLKDAPGCLFLNLKLEVVLCGTAKCKAGWSVSYPGVIH